MKRSEAPKYTCQDSEEGIGGAHEWIWTHLERSKKFTTDRLEESSTDTPEESS